MSKRNYPSRNKVSGFWLTKIPGSDRYYLCWYDPDTKQRRTRSTGTSDIRAAEEILALHALKHGRIEKHADPATVPLQRVLLTYWEKHACKTASAETNKAHLRDWSDYFGAAMVADVTADRVEDFVTWLRDERRLKPSSIDRTLAIGRAALKRAYRRNEVTSIPVIEGIETADERATGREPKGRPVTLQEIASLLDAIPDDHAHEHLWRFAVLAINTMARPNAILDLRSDMVDFGASAIRLLPPGMKPTKKRRPRIPLTRTLEPWLRLWGEGHYITWRGRKIKQIDNAWRWLRAQVFPAEKVEIPPDAKRTRKRLMRLRTSQAGADVNPYSIRHTMGRELRRRRVDGDEISLMLGHKIVDENDVTSIYSPHDPDYCRHAASEIEAICRQIDSLMTKRRLILPDADSKVA